MMAWLLLLLASLLWFAAYKIRRRNMYKLASLLPAPVEELPVIGSTHSLAGSAVGKSCFVSRGLLL